MIILVILLAAIVVALFRGGRLTHLSELHIRFRGLFILGFLIQVLIYSDFWQSSKDLNALTPYGYILSLLVLLISLAANYQIPGIPLIAAGFLLNFIAIALNGGFMPGAPSAYQMAGLPVLQPGQVSTNSVGMGPDTRLYFLGDIFAIPKELPFHNIFSIGDTLIAIGAVYLLQKAMVREIPQPVV